VKSIIAPWPQRLRPPRLPPKRNNFFYKLKSCGKKFSAAFSFSTAGWGIMDEHIFESTDPHG